MLRLCSAVVIHPILGWRSVRVSEGSERQFSVCRGRGEFWGVLSSGAEFWIVLVTHNLTPSMTSARGAWTIAADSRFYHNDMGNIHCGTNVKRAIPSYKWWEK